MGKKEFKSPRSKGLLGQKRPLTRSRAATVTSANIKVVVRVRPPNEREQGENSRQVIKLVDDQVLIFDPKVASQAFFYHGVEQKRRDLLRKENKDLQFMFDKVFGFESSNEEVFDSTTKSLIQYLMDGYNCSVFAYGATGAGKTHTMIGNNDNPGITYLTMAALFKAKDELQEERNFELGISYIEVYNEQVQDLLNPGPPLQLRDDGRYGVMVSGIKIHKIDGPDELFSLLEKGNGNRTQHPTDANAESSRSHAVFQVYIHMETKTTREMRAVKLSMIDLAGSERGSATGYGGARFAEGANINKSLLALGNCINSLADGQNYIPYRDSKLTRLLKDSLGGNCQTVMIANISPSSLSYDDTYNTLKYATRAKTIKSEIKKSIVNVELHVGEYAKIVEDLKKELDSVKAQLRETTYDKPIDGKLRIELGRLVEERKSVIFRIHQIEASENAVVLRRRLKESADSRLSGFLIDMEEKEEAHRRIGDSVNRFCRQEDCLEAELEKLKLEKLNKETEMNRLGVDNPEMKHLVQIKNEELRTFEANHQRDLMDKKCAILEDELRSRGELLAKTCHMLQSCFLQLRGHGFVTDTLAQEYQSLVNHLQGRRNISWDSDLDSGLSSTTSISSTDTNKAPKIIERENRSVLHNLDRTYVMVDYSKPKKIRVCAGEIMAKVYKTPTAIKKKKELQQRVVSAARMNGADKKMIRNNVIKQRPPFRT